MDFLHDPHTTRMILVGMGTFTILALVIMGAYLRSIRHSAEATTARSNTAISELRLLRQMSFKVEVALIAERFAESRLHRLVSIIRDAYVAIDESGRIIAWNAAAVLMFGYSQDEAIGQDVTILMPQRIRSHHSKAFSGFLLTRGATIRPERYLDSTAVDSNGNEFDVRIAIWATELPDSVICNALIHRRVEGDARRDPRRREDE